jgi:hypothetical protein
MSGKRKGDLLKRHFGFVFISVMLLFILAGCVTEDVSVAGVWEQRIEEYVVRLTFIEDGTFYLQVGDRSRTIEGEYKTRGDVIMLTDSDCGDSEGKYRIKTREGSISFSLLNDACDGRESVVVGEWKQVEN